MTDKRKLLAWAAAIIDREQQAGAYGQVSVILEAGKIVRVETRRTEKPGNAQLDTAAHEDEMTQIEASIAKGARRSDHRFKL